VTMAVYIEGVSDLAGYELQVQFDSTAVSLEGVTADGSGEINLLKSNGGFVVGFTTVRGQTVSQAAAILGPTAENLGQGTGLLGVFAFRVSDRFFGTTELTATQLLLSAQSGGTDTIRAFSRAQIEVADLTRQISVTSTRDTLSSSGADASTLTVKLYDLDGLAYSQDDTSVVTFEATSSNGSIDGGKTVNKTVAAGQTTAEVKSSGEGDITVLISLSGARPVQVVLVVSSAPAVGEGPVGPMALDLNVDEAGDQALRFTAVTPKVGDTVEIELIATEGAIGLSGYQATLQFDSEELTYVENSFVAAGLFSGGVAIVTSRTGVVSAAVAFFGSTTSASDAGSLGKLAFTVAAGYSGKARVTLSSGQYGSASGHTKLTIGAGGAAVQVGAQSGSGGTGGPVTATPDLNGNGTVDFPDFIAFAFAFGSSDGDANFNAQADLNGNGTIDFPDFLVFASAFGGPAPTKRAGLAKPVGERLGANSETVLSLVPVPTRTEHEAVVAIAMTDAIDVMGYNVRLNYDTEVLELVDVVGPQGSLFGAAIQTITADGALLVADVLQADAALQGSQDLMVLHFRVLDPTQVGRVDIAQAILSDGGNHLNTLVGAHLSDVRALPEDYSLTQNFPNPFNPETIIPFAVPISGEMSVVIYNILGQEVVTLASGMREAGFYRLVWNGRDHLGRSVASGIYFVRLAAGEFIGVRKMLLLK